jgi:hypothetical protein
MLATIQFDLSSFRLLSKNLKIKIYKNIIVPAALYGCKNSSFTKRRTTESVSKIFRTESITKYNRSEATKRVMAAKLTRLTHKIAIQLHLVAERCTICSSRSRRPVRKLLDTPSYTTHWCSDKCTQNFVAKREGRRPLGRPWHRWEDNIRRRLGGCGLYSCGSG